MIPVLLTKDEADKIVKALRRQAAAVECEYKENLNKNNITYSETLLDELIALRCIANVVEIEIFKNEKK